MRTKKFIIPAIIIVLGLIVAAVYIWFPGFRYAPEPPLPTTLKPGKVSVRPIDHIVVIMEENKPYGSIIGSPDAPYINGLARKYALASNYLAVTHPSLPNYLALTSGTTGTVTSDCQPSGSCEIKSTNLADEIEKSGRTWKEYAESMPAPCTSVNSGDYAVRHNPFMYYPDIVSDQARCRAHVVPFTQLTADLKSTDSLPDFSFITPDLCNDMHNCSVQTGDSWLARHVPQILASPAFTRQRSLLVITWDEGSHSDNRVPAIFAGPAARQAHVSSVAYSHYSLLHTIESAWNLKTLTHNDRLAPLMNDMLR